MFEDMTTVTQGSVGLGMAIAYFTTNGYVVSLPLIDNQNYDLVIEKGEGLKRVQVKTTQYKEKGHTVYTVGLRSIRSNKTQNVIKKYDSNGNDLLFVLTESGDKYLIPSADVHGQASLCLGKKADKWKIDP